MATVYKVDYECNGEVFWVGVEFVIRTCPVARFGEWLLQGVSDMIVLTDVEALLINPWLEGCPGWTDLGYPEYVQHPIVIREARR